MPVLTVVSVKFYQNFPFDKRIMNFTIHLFMLFVIFISMDSDVPFTFAKVNHSKQPNAHRGTILKSNARLKMESSRRHKSHLRSHHAIKNADSTKTGKSALSANAPKKSHKNNKKQGGANLGKTQFSMKHSKNKFSVTRIKQKDSLRRPKKDKKSFLHNFNKRNSKYKMHNKKGSKKLKTPRKPNKGQKNKRGKKRFIKKGARVTKRGLKKNSSNKNVVPKISKTTLKSNNSHSRGIEYTVYQEEFKKNLKEYSKRCDKFGNKTCYEVNGEIIRRPPPFLTREEYMNKEFHSKQMKDVELAGTVNKIEMNDNAFANNFDTSVAEITESTTYAIKLERSTTSTTKPLANPKAAYSISHEKMVENWIKENQNKTYTRDDLYYITTSDGRKIPNEILFFCSDFDIKRQICYKRKLVCQEKDCLDHCIKGYYIEKGYRIDKIVETRKVPYKDDPEPCDFYIWDIYTSGERKICVQVNEGDIIPKDTCVSIERIVRAYPHLASKIITAFEKDYSGKLGQLDRRNNEGSAFGYAMDIIKREISELESADCEMVVDSYQFLKPYFPQFAEPCSWT